jgi:hypothetical protein
MRRTDQPEYPAFQTGRTQRGQGAASTRSHREDHSRETQGTMNNSATVGRSLRLSDVFTPTPKQMMLQESRANEILYGGQSGGGKSRILRWELLKWCLTIPGLQAYLFRRIQPELEKNHIIPSRMEFPKSVGHYREQKHRWEFPVGDKISMLHFCHCQHEKDVFQYQGSEIHILGVDESTLFSQFMLEYLRSRVRCTLKIPREYQCRVPGIIYCTNPGGLSHGYHKRRFIDYLKPYKLRRGPENEGRMMRQFIPSKLSDNPHLMKADPGYFDRMKDLPEPYRSALMFGNWDIFIGQMFNFNVQDHVIKPLPVPDNAPLYWSLDWGFGKPYSVGYWWVDQDGRLYRFSEIYGNMRGDDPDIGLRQSDPEIAERILAHEAKIGIQGRSIVRLADPTGWNKKPDYAGGGQGPSTAEEFARHGIYMNPGDPNRILKVRQMHSRLRTFKDKAGNTLQLPMLVAYDTCENFIRTITELQADPLNPEYWDDRQEDHCVEEAVLVIQARPMGTTLRRTRTTEQAAREAAI